MAPSSAHRVAAELPRLDERRRALLRNARGCRGSPPGCEGSQRARVSRSVPGLRPADVGDRRSGWWVRGLLLIDRSDGARPSAFKRWPVVVLRGTGARPPASYELLPSDGQRGSARSRYDADSRKPQASVSAKSACLVHGPQHKIQHLVGPLLHFALDQVLA
jgi:hypothetical protein